MKTFLLYTTAFLSGFSLMGYEILGSRVLAPHFGGSVYVWGGLIAVFMLGLSIGYLLGGHLADKHNSCTELGFIIFCSVVFIFPVSFLGKLICSNISTLPIDIKYSALIASVLLFTVPCICLGAISPYLVKLSLNKQNGIGRKAGNVYAASTVGSIFGVLFVSFYLISLVGTNKGIQLLCLPLLICCILSFTSHLFKK
jgi:MFS family permease